MTTLEHLSPETVHPTRGYTHAVRVGDLLFVSGQVAQDQKGGVVGQGDIAAQLTQVFANLNSVLQAAGSDLAHVIKTTVFVIDADYRAAYIEAREAVFGPIGHFPASTYLVVSRLGTPDWLVEIEAIASVK